MTATERAPAEAVMRSGTPGQPPDKRLYRHEGVAAREAEWGPAEQVQLLILASGPDAAREPLGEPFATSENATETRVRPER